MGENDYSWRRRGHGLRPPSDTDVTYRREAARQVLRALEDGADPKRFAVIEEAARMWGGIFRDIRHQRSPDWFLTSAMVSIPTPIAAQKIARDFDRLASATRKRSSDETGTLLRSLGGTYLPARLERYLACSRAENPIPWAIEGSWLYLLRSNEEWGVLNLGTISGLMETALQEMDEINPELAPYGITAAWLVRDDDTAYEIASRTLEHAYIQPDFYEFDHWSEIASMKDGITEHLQNAGQLVGRPQSLSPSWPMNHPTRPAPHAIVPDRTEEDVVDVPGVIAP